MSNYSLAGKKYQPSNGTDGDIFMGRWCTRCTKDDEEAGMYCPIIVAAMAYRVSDDEYPEEWRYDADGHPECTAFQSYDELLEGT